MFTFHSANLTLMEWSNSQEMSSQIVSAGVMVQLTEPR
jgi:hypothetical protein